MKLKRLFVIIFSLLFVLVLSSCDDKDNNDNPKDDTEEEIKYEEIESSYVMLNMDHTKDDKSYMYSDSYFLNESFNKDLMKTSYAIQYFSVDPLNGDSSDKVYKEELTKLGYSNFYVNDYFKEGTKIDNIGMMFSSKDVKIKNNDYKIINLALRGNAYYFEWAGNFIIGNEGDHKGFKTAAIKTIEELNKYAKSINAKDVILWITGYSRAAAVANLTAAYIDNYINYKETNTWLTEEYKIESLDFNLKLKDLYCYCFETPSGALIENQNKLAKVTYNIYNIINEADVVPMVLPKDFGFTKYGFINYYNKENDLEFKSLLKEKYKDGYESEVNEYVFSITKKSDEDKLFTSFGPLNIYLHKLDTKAKVKDYFDEQIKLLVDLFKTRNNYSSLVDNLVDELFTKFISLSNENRKLFIEDLKNNFLEAGYLSLIIDKTKINEVLKKTCDKYEITLSDESYDSLSKIRELVFDLVSKELTPDNDGYMSKRVATIYNNFMNMGVNHFPEFIEVFINLI